MKQSVRREIYCIGWAVDEIIHIWLYSPMAFVAASTIIFKFNNVIVEVNIKIAKY